MVVPKSGPKLVLEPVSSRLRRTLAHPNKTAGLVGVRYSADGKRIIAGDYPGGVIQVWDAATGKQLTKLETGYGYRSSADYFFLSPDWKTIYVSREKRKATRFEKDGKKLIRWEFTGDVRAWELDSGELRHSFKHNPPRGILGMTLSPDGAAMATVEELPGESEGGPKQAASLWDMKTGQHRALSGEIAHWSVYSPDGKTLAGSVGSQPGHVAVKLFDVATAKEKLTIPVREPDTWLGYIAFSPDGKLLVGQVRDEVKTGRHWLKFWDPSTGKELGSVEGEKKDVFSWMAFSPDGRTLAVTNSTRDGQGKLFLFDLARKRLAKTIALGEKAVVRRPAYSPHGEWIAVAWQPLPKTFQIREPNALDFPQPRIHLIDAASGVVRETLVAPQGFIENCCFSPDGKTLATGGYGKVLLWDLTQPPGTLASSGNESTGAP